MCEVAISVGKGLGSVSKNTDYLDVDTAAGSKTAQAHSLLQPNTRWRERERWKESKGRENGRREKKERWKRTSATCRGEMGRGEEREVRDAML